MNTVEININGYGKGTVKLDGLDVSNVVYGLDVHSVAGVEAPTITLTVAARHGLHFIGEAHVDLDALSAELLQRLGWTPPGTAASGDAT